MPKSGNILEKVKGAEKENVQISILDFVALCGTNSVVPRSKQKRDNISQKTKFPWYYYQFPVSSEDYSKRERTSRLKRHHGDLLGKYFRNRITEAIKSKKQTKEIFTEHNIKPFPWNPSHAPRWMRAKHSFYKTTEINIWSSFKVVPSHVKLNKQ